MYVNERVVERQAKLIFVRYHIGPVIAVILENFQLDDEYIKDYQIKKFIQRYMVSQKVTETIVDR